ncbi:MAG: basic secretory protein-like protein [Chitinophagaceae bacterium]
MKKLLPGTLIATMIIFCVSRAAAQETETFKRDNLTLNFTTKDSTFDLAVKKRMIETFFKVYPQLMKEYNPASATTVNFVIDTAYKGVAATGGGKIVFNPEWFKKHPGDIDVVTHEVMHIVQDYGRSGGPGWLTEGIADYVRFKYGVNNPGANWSLTEFKPTQNYNNSYRITARFLHWMETHGNKGLVKKLDANLRAHTFTPEIWKSETGKTLDELWSAYAENPAI